MRLRARGHDVYAPTLTGLGERAHLASPDAGLTTHIDDVVSVAEFDDLDDVILVGTSSGGTVITGVANRVPGRIASLVYLDAFLPSDGQCTFDLLPPERRGVLEGLIETEGDGWLLPRFAPAPWPVIVRDIWRVTDPADAGWMLPRLRPTPARHFTEPVPPPSAAAGDIDRIYIRCLQSTPAPQFDAAAEIARSDPAWRYVALDTPHLPCVTHPDAVVTALTDVISPPR
jgi:pimeloyl-ACP methyl ester carboxylesterase